MKDHSTEPTEATQDTPETAGPDTSTRRQTYTKKSKYVKGPKWHANVERRRAAAAIKAAGMRIRQQLIWYKHMVLGHSDYHWSHEPILYCTKDERGPWWGDRTATTIILNTSDGDISKLKKEALLILLMAIRTQSTVIDAKKDAAKDYEHPTQKPVALMVNAIGNSSPLGGIVLDLFGGGGSTMIACEKMGRRCYMMEAVTIQRWQEFTGKEAVKL